MAEAAARAGHRGPTRRRGYAERRGAAGVAGRGLQAGLGLRQVPAVGDPQQRSSSASGNSDADLMFVGEAPGAEEDRQGLPFVGRAGNFLTELLEGIGMRREDVFIANVLKCRPPGNRDPQPEEIDSCRPWLEEQVRLIEPRVIGTLGNFATKLLTGSPTGITKVRGTAQHHTLGGRPVLLLPLFHPAAGLRTPRVAEQLREDFALIPGLLAEPLLDLEPEPAFARAGDEDQPRTGRGRPRPDGPVRLDRSALRGRRIGACRIRFATWVRSRARPRRSAASSAMTRRLCGSWPADPLRAARRARDRVARGLGLPALLRGTGPLHRPVRLAGPAQQPASCAARPSPTRRRSSASCPRGERRSASWSGTRTSTTPWTRRRSRGASAARPTDRARWRT